MIFTIDITWMLLLKIAIGLIFGCIVIIGIPFIICKIYGKYIVIRILLEVGYDYKFIIRYFLHKLTTDERNKILDNAINHYKGVE